MISVHINLDADNKINEGLDCFEESDLLELLISQKVHVGTKISHYVKEDIKNN